MPNASTTPGPSVSPFDTPIDRTQSDSAKWTYYPAGTLPLWVADMDFASPQPIVDALRARADHAVFGYAMDSVSLREAVVTRLAARYGWQITPDMIVFLPGLVSGLNVVARAVGATGDGILVNTPVYPPFLSATTNQARTLHNAPLAKSTRHDGARRPYLHYALDFDAFAHALQPNTRLYMLCNPHNPVGRAYSRAELEAVGEFALYHDLVICSDEIHAELVLGDTAHIPLASLSPELAARTITLIAPSKTFNVPGLGCSLAIIPDPTLRNQLQQASAGIVPHVNLMGYVAAEAAYTQCDPWLEALLAYLTANRDFLVDTVRARMPKVELTVPEATYLGWLDFSAYGLENPYEFFLENAKVALSAGTPFGAGGEQFVRLNFGCPRATLQQALDQMTAALERAA
jgi:cystathionine beta-lyase